MDYRVGDWVEVLSIDEIVESLDERGAADGMPFMPEMRQFCGRRFRVSASAHKTCDTIYSFKSRRLEDAVHLENLRCDGGAHDGCQALCLLFWKSTWIKPLPTPATPALIGVRPPFAGNSGVHEVLSRSTRLRGGALGDEKACYSCQATRLLDATQPLAWYEFAQYWKDLRSRNVGLARLLKYALLAGYNMLMRTHWRGRPYPGARGLLAGPTPTDVLNLREGELVEVKSKEEIMRTLNQRQRNRGLWFDVEQIPHCGKQYRVHKRVERIINEQTGEMMSLSNPCIILDGVACSGCYSRDRLFCPRSIYSYWREIWLRRVPIKAESEPSKAIEKYASKS